MTTPLRVQVDLPFTGEAWLTNDKPIDKIQYVAYSGEFRELGVRATAYSVDHDNEEVQLDRNHDPYFMAFPAPPRWFLEVAREMGAIR